MDRNIVSAFDVLAVSASLSARRAWIEIRFSIFDFLNLSSLSARRAWIEIIKKGRARRPGQTSLSARRAWIEILASRLTDMSDACRSPQGERG